MNIELTDDQINNIVIEDLKLQIRFTENQDEAEALQRTLDFYTGVTQQHEINFMYGDPDNISININGHAIF